MIDTGLREEPVEKNSARIFSKRVGRHRYISAAV